MKRGKGRKWRAWGVNPRDCPVHKGYATSLREVWGNRMRAFQQHGCEKCVVRVEVQEIREPNAPRRGRGKRNAT